MSAKLTAEDVYAAIGEAGIARVVARFYQRVPADPVLGSMYSDRDLAGAEMRLREFLIQRFGGPDRYSQQRGHPRLRMRHAPFQITADARDHWLANMEQALKESEVPAAVAGAMWAYFVDSAAFMINVM